MERVGEAVVVEVVAQGGNEHGEQLDLGDKVRGDGGEHEVGRVQDGDGVAEVVKGVLVVLRAHLLQPLAELLLVNVKLLNDVHLLEDADAHGCQVLIRLVEGVKLPEKEV